MAMVGLNQRFICDNVNLFMKSALDPITGAVTVGASDARVGDYIEFYAEAPVLCVFSLCPAGAGSDTALLAQEYVDPPIFPVRLDTFATEIPPLEWAT